MSTRIASHMYYIIGERKMRILINKTTLHQNTDTNYMTLLKINQIQFEIKRKIHQSEGNQHFKSGYRKI